MPRVLTPEEYAAFTDVLQTVGRSYVIDTDDDTLAIATEAPWELSYELGWAAHANPVFADIQKCATSFMGLPGWVTFNGFYRPTKTEETDPCPDS